MSPGFNNSFQVIGLCGYSKDGKTFYADKRLPRYLTLKSGIQIDLYKYLIIHEMCERHCEYSCNMLYPEAHQMATQMERTAVERDGIAWGEYQGYLLTQIEKLSKITGPIPPDLDLKPEVDTNDKKGLKIAKRWGVFE